MTNLRRFSYTYPSRNPTNKKIEKEETPSTIDIRCKTTLCWGTLKKGPYEDKRRTTKKILDRGRIPTYTRLYIIKALREIHEGSILFYCGSMCAVDATTERLRRKND